MKAVQGTPRRPAFKGRRALWIVGIVIVLTLLICGLSYAFLALKVTPPVESSLFTIQQGEGVNRVIDALGRDGAVRSPAAAKVFYKAWGHGRFFQSGTYRLKTESLKELFTSFFQGDVAMVSVTFIEGMTYQEMAQHLQKVKMLSSASQFIRVVEDPAFLKQVAISASTAQGYLFPDTYFFPVGASAREIALAMISEFFEKVRALPQTSSLTGAELYKKIIMASLIQGEYHEKEDAPLIASVFYNRVRSGMRLDSDASIKYLIMKKNGFTARPRRVYFKDLKIDSPENTYLYAGLPPRPISNPGEVALKASLAPAHTNYLYFVVERHGSFKHVFSATFAQQQRNVEAYRNSRPS